jgi:site-specific recombinase XerD
VGLQLRSALLPLGWVLHPRWLVLGLANQRELRISELLLLQPENVRMDGEELTLVFKRLKAGCSPGGKTKPIVSRYTIPESIREDLLAHAKRTPTGRRLFPITRQYFNDLMLAAAHRAGLDPRLCHPHAVRHGLGRRWATMTNNPFELQALLGHRGTAVLATYCSLANAVETSKKFLR